MRLPLLLYSIMQHLATAGDTFKPPHWHVNLSFEKINDLID